MTYFGFLFRFLVLPILGLLVLWVARLRSSRHRDGARIRWPLVVGATLTMVVVAVTYTTPWDNYLVATRVWWYDPALVSGLVIGWVPIEEYTFFILQPILGGLWLANLAIRPASETAEPNGLPRIIRGAVWMLALWLLAAVALILDLPPVTYLGLELVWALPPLILQVAFGGDLLWRRRWLVAAGILPLTIYLSLADSLAIAAGTWTIDPDQSLGVLIGGVLPLEEAVFFLLTNMLVTFGVVLIWSPESKGRARRWLWAARTWAGRTSTGRAPVSSRAGRPPR